MKIAAVGKWHKYSSYFLHGVVEGAIQNGWSAMGVDYVDGGLELAKSALRSYKPDFIFCHMLFSDDGPKVQDKLKLLRGIKKYTGSKIFYQMGDPRIIPRHPECKVDDLIDAVLIAHQEHEQFSSYGVPIIYWPYGTLKMDFPKKKENRYEMLFCGSYPSESWLYQERTRFISAMVKTKMLKTLPEEGMSNTTFVTNELASIAGAFLNILGKHDINMFLSLRPFQFIGAGALSIQKYLKGIEKVFVDRKHHIVFDNFDVKEVLNLYKYFVVKHPEKGETIRREGWEYCQQNHPYLIRMKDVIDVFSGKRDRVRYLLEDYK